MHGSLPFCKLFIRLKSINFLAALRYITKEDATPRDAANKLKNSLINIKAIVAHFNMKIESFSHSNQTVILTEEQVLEVICTNYDTLTLKLSDHLDVYQPYNPVADKESLFIKHILASIIDEFKRCNASVINAGEHSSLVHHIQNHSAVIDANPVPPSM